MRGLVLIRVASKILNKLFTITGFKYCHCCGHYNLFYWDNNYEALLKRTVPGWGGGNDYTQQIIKRENEFCIRCGSFFRIRAVAKTILRLFNFSRPAQLINFLKDRPYFIIYETANYWLFRDKKFKKVDNYIVSEFHPIYTFGEKAKGVRNENLEKLTFNNQTVDLLVTTDVLEHVTDLEKSLSEIRRVLKVGGYHIFTVPVNYSLDRTRQRALMGESGEITNLLPPAFHGNDITDGILVYRDFGRDIDNIIKEYGFSCQEEKYYLDGKHIVSIYISRKV